jgi:hypothetical protein
MILLLHSKGPEYQGQVPQHVRPVVYRNIEEIPDRLRASAPGRVDSHAKADHSPGFPVSEGRPIEPKSQGNQQKKPALPEEDMLSPNDGEPPVDTSSQHDVFASPEKVRAVLVIETAYRRVNTRRGELLKGVNATRARLWSLLHQRVSSMEWPKSTRYKFMMQGPLVHILVCLDGVKMFADYINKDLKRQLRGDDHKRLEELIEKSDRSR